jgi:hypothetical protein
VCTLAADGDAWWTWGPWAVDANAGAAASAPDTATTGPATAARCAAFWTGEGRRCRPLPLSFLVLLSWADLTNLP